MNADVYDHVPAADNWWEPIRSALMLALDVPDEPMSPERASLFLPARWPPSCMTQP
jgi:hypothetical protein